MAAHLPVGVACRLRDAAQLARAALRRGSNTGVGRWLRTITPSGWAVAAAVVVALGLAGLAGWVEAAAVAIVGGACLVIGLLSVIGGSHYEVEVAMPQRTVAGSTVLGELRVRNSGARRVGLGLMELPVTTPDGPAEAQFLVSRLAAAQQWSDVFALPSRRRGVVRIGPPRSVRSDGLGLVRKIHVWAKPATLYVNPRTVRVPFDATGYQVDAEGVTTSTLSSSDVAFHALRDYTPGDDRRFVHWPTTARLGRLMVRQFEETRRSHHLIVLDTDEAVWDADSFELGVSVAASFARAAVSAGRAVSLSTSSRWVSTRAPAQLLDELTELEPETGADTAGRLTKVIAERPMASVLTIVTGDVADAQVSRWASLAGLGITTNAVRAAPSRPAGRRTFGTALAIDCPSLDDLPRLVAARALFGGPPARREAHP